MTLSHTYAHAVENGKRVIVEVDQTEPRISAVINGMRTTSPISHVTRELLMGTPVKVDLTRLFDLSSEWDPRLAAVLILWAIHGLQDD